MKKIKVGAAVLNLTPLDWEENKRTILAALSAAKSHEVSILCLPELCITGYGCEDMFLSPSVRERALQTLLELIPSTKGVVVSFGLPFELSGSIYNVAALVCDGKLLGLVAKQFLADAGVHYESRWFRPWVAEARVEVKLGGETIPFGDLVFDISGVRLGFEICEDAWVSSRPGGRLAARGVDIILNPSASHFAFGKIEQRKELVLSLSKQTGVSYVYANLLGNEAGRIIYDGGALIADAGKLVAQGPRFLFANFQLTTAVVEPNVPDPAPDRSVSESICADFSFGKSVSARSSGTPPWETGGNVKEEEFSRAVSLGLFDYLRKSRMQGFVISLSGGADSGALACLVMMMVELSVAELGIDGVKGKLEHIASIQGAETVSGIVGSLLTCVYQKTENSSKTTLDAARSLATELGATFLELDVDPLVRSYEALGAGVLKTELNWNDHDLALQNIQARVRSPGVWLIANLKGALLLATSNRSEASVGYATMDGDTSGGLAPIAGIDKAYLREWLKWLQSNAPEGATPVTALSLINVQAPTAELRPQSARQTDEADLMPYTLLNAIEHLAIAQKKSPVEVYKALSAASGDYAKQDLCRYITRFFQLWARNQWKRERIAPAFHLDDLNVDPRSWCRFPILSGAFTAELKELGELVKEESQEKV